jgi:CRISPR-associated protein Cas5d
MSNRGSPHTIEVWGEFACFASPMKVERWSYPFITPSAARGIFDAIFVNRHEFRWEIEQIEILSEPKYIALMRNEVKEKGPSEREVLNWMEDPSQIKPILADGDKLITGDDKHGRTQRQTMALRDVRYRLTGRIVTWPNPPKAMPAYEEQFKRRLDRGQHFIHPTLGCREFPAWWGPTTDLSRWEGDIDAGWMLYDVFDLSRPGESTSKASVSLFRARAEKGIVDVPAYTDERVRKAVTL